MPFIEDTLSRARPASIGSVALPRRQTYFPSPVDWRDEVLYFLLVDRFSDGKEDNPRPKLDRANRQAARPNVAGQPWSWHLWAQSAKDHWQGGTIDGVRGKLGYLRDLGVTTIWLSPVFKQRGHLDTFHGYGVQDFLEIDPHFGTRQDLVRLVAEAHQMGMRILLDIIFNHSGSNWRYPPNTPGGPDKALYTTGRYSFGAWRDADGNPIANNRGIGGPDDGAWPSELQDPDDYTRAGSGNLGAGDIADPFAEHKRSDFEDLRDFDLDRRVGSETTLGFLASCYNYWIALSDCDGFRIDTLKHVTFEQARNFCGGIKEYAANLGKANFFLVGEIAGGDFNEQHYLDVIGRNLNAALDIGGMRLALTSLAKGFANPNDYFGGFDPGNVDMGSHRNVGNQHVSILDDHDHVFGTKLRFSTNVPSDHQVVAGVAIQLFTLGIPCVYYGTEQAFAGPEESEQKWLIGEGWGKDDWPLRETMFGPEHPRRRGRAGLPADGSIDPNLPGFGSFGTAGHHCFDPEQGAYRRIAALTKTRRAFPVLRYGRQYLRPVSLFGGSFEVRGNGELLAWSRILGDEEALCLVNANGAEPRGGDVLVDADLNSQNGAAFRVVANSIEAAGIGGPATHPIGSRLMVKRKESGIAYVEVRGLPPLRS